MQLGKVILTDVQSAWLAAAVDGEGTITVLIKRDQNTSRPLIEPHISIFNTNKAFLDCAKSIIGWGNVYRTKSSTINDMYEYRLNSGNLCKQVLNFILPYLIIKKFQAQKLLMLLNRPTRKYTLEDLAVYEDIKKANDRRNYPLLKQPLYLELKLRLEAGGD